MDEKTLGHNYTVEAQINVGDNDVVQYTGTNNDVQDMRRLGKKQEFKRNFRFISIIGFVTIIQATWESTLLTNSFGLLNGGTAGVIWSTIAVWLCVMAMTASMAEMASMAPTAGGQYHWVSEFAPSSFQKPLSYVVGWCCCLGWIAGNPACGQIIAGLIQGMVILGNPDTGFGSLWQTTLLIFLFLILAAAFNIFLTRYLPLTENIALVVHGVSFVAFLGTLWGTSEISTARDVFTSSQDGGGWGNIGLSTLVGLSTPLWCFVAPDAGAHMSEELHDASLSLPQAMMWSTFFGGVMGVATMITFCFCAGDINDILDSSTGVPIIQVLYDSTQSFVATCVLTTLLAILMIFSTITGFATVSRQCWAFARDKGFPFSSWIVQVRPIFGAMVPLNSLLVVLGVSLTLASINFGSDVALNAIISLSNAALLFSYFISIGCVRLKRLRGESLLPRRWDLGKLGGPVNDVALVFLFVGFVFSFFPQTPMIGDPNWAADFNWAIVMFAATCLLAFVYYWVGGKNTYVPPVRLVRKD